MPFITALFHHVKGHQKETADCKLTLPEKLNIDCDSCAATLQPPPSTAPHCTHPLNSAGHPHLVIQGNVITQRLQHTLRDAATKHIYFDYLTEKFHWTENPEQAIHWPILRLTLKRFKAMERRTLQKFLHEWLPLQDQHHVQSASAEKLCPSCHQAAETVDHFFACPHPGQQQIWKELHKSLHHHQINNSVSNIFHDMYAYGLYHGCLAPTHLTFHHLPTDLEALYLTQAQIGWCQLYYGRLTPLWAELIQQHHPQINSNIYLTKCTTLVWQATLQIWKLRNEHLHPGNRDQEDRSQLQAAVNQIFAEASKDPQLQAMIENLSPDQIMSRPTWRIRQWVLHSNNHMRAHAKVVKLQAHLRTRDIRQYFPRRTPQPT